jgi:hypothetical protein
MDEHEQVQNDNGPTDNAHLKLPVRSLISDPHRQDEQGKQLKADKFVQSM